MEAHAFCSTWVCDIGVEWSCVKLEDEERSEKKTAARRNMDVSIFYHLKPRIHRTRPEILRTSDHVKTPNATIKQNLSCLQLECDVRSAIFFIQKFCLIG